MFSHLVLLDDKEERRLREYVQAMEMSPEAILKQALRYYDLIHQASPESRERALKLLRPAVLNQFGCMGDY